MKQKIWMIFFIFCIGGSLGAPATAWNGMEAPSWHMGACWQVRVSYADPVNTERWSDPVLWDYCVVDETDGVFTLNIRRSEDGSLAAVLRLGAESLAPVSVDTVKHRRGKSVYVTTPFNEVRPLTTRNSMAPIDLPVFPLEAGEIFRYTETGEVAGDLVRTRQMMVTITESQLPDTAGVSDDDGNYLKVTVSYGSGEVLFTQYWQQACPWPVFGENSSMRYWRVDDEE